jgi:hypothetical protein
MVHNLNLQNVFQLASGEALSTHNSVTAVVDKFSYPLTINFTVLADDGSFCRSLEPGRALTFTLQRVYTF